MEQNICKNCKWFLEGDLIQGGLNGVKFVTGTCMCSPFDIDNMKPNDMAIFCGHDGPIYVGEYFGCINYNKESRTE